MINDKIEQKSHEPGDLLIIDLCSINELSTVFLSRTDRARGHALARLALALGSARMALLPPSRPDEVERPEPGYLLELACVLQPCATSLFNSAPSHTHPKSTRPTPLPPQKVFSSSFFKILTPYLCKSESDRFFANVFHRCFFSRVCPLWRMHRDL